MRNILFIVPFNLEDVESKSSFMDCAKAVEPRISSPILRVSCAKPVSHHPGRRRDNRQKLTSFSLWTLLLRPNTCESFWLSSSDSTASLYGPLGFVYCALGTPTPAATPTPCPPAPG